MVDKPKISQEGEVSREKFELRPYSPDAYHDVRIVEDSFVPKNIDEHSAVERGRLKSIISKAIAFAGIGLLIIITLSAVASFLGFTLSKSPASHEDAVRLLLLIVGGIMGSLYNAKFGKMDD